MRCPLGALLVYGTVPGDSNNCDLFGRQVPLRKCGDLQYLLKYRQCMRSRATADTQTYVLLSHTEATTTCVETYCRD